MEIEPTSIQGVDIVRLVHHTDERGSFTEDYRAEWAGTFVQSNLSRSRAGVLRGMHFHRRQYDYWCYGSGRALVNLYDLRSGSPTEDSRVTIEMDATDTPSHGIVIPPGVAHGFYAITDVVMHYMVSIYHDGSDEFGFLWQDIGGWDLALEGGEKVVLSERDRTAPPLSWVERPEYPR